MGAGLGNGDLARIWRLTWSGDGSREVRGDYAQITR
jgi:hypothetical protein